MGARRGSSLRWRRSGHRPHKGPRPERCPPRTGRRLRAACGRRPTSPRDRVPRSPQPPAPAKASRALRVPGPPVLPGTRAPRSGDTAAGARAARRGRGRGGWGRARCHGGRARVAGAGAGAGAARVAGAGAGAARGARARAGARARVARGAGRRARGKAEAGRARRPGRRPERQAPGAGQSEAPPARQRDAGHGRGRGGFVRGGWQGPGGLRLRAAPHSAGGRGEPGARGGSRLPPPSRESPGEGAPAPEVSCPWPRSWQRLSATPHRPLTFSLREDRPRGMPHGTAVGGWSLKKLGPCGLGGS